MKYVLYFRLSKQKKDKKGNKIEIGLGIKAQETIANYYFKPYEVAGRYYEVKSGKNVTKRPELRKAMDLCIEGEYTLVVAKLDRLTRSMLDFELIYDELDGRIHSCDTSTKGSPTPKEYFQMKMIFAEKERELISIRTKQALAEKKKDGIKLGNPKVDKSYSVYAKKATDAVRIKARENENNLRSYRYISSLKKENKTLQEICDNLNISMFRTSKGCKFSPTQVSRIIKMYENE